MWKISVVDQIGPFLIIVRGGIIDELIARRGPKGQIIQNNNDNNGKTKRQHYDLMWNTKLIPTLLTRLKCNLIII